ncbi:MAG: hypothetical protein GX575_30790 [Candidatus Anammoximicrobium sp.]|nr:hypothetical protein [Candidatus Anammoximicrobium sp.]
MPTLDRRHLPGTALGAAATGRLRRGGGTSNVRPLEKNVAHGSGPRALSLALSQAPGSYQKGNQKSSFPPLGRHDLQGVELRR